MRSRQRLKPSIHWRRANATSSVRGKSCGQKSGHRPVYGGLCLFHKGMKIATITFRLRASWVHSLKEKRMIVKSLIAKLQNRFHVSAAEIDEQDVHQIIVIGVAAIVPHNALADSMMDEISRFVEEICEAEILDEVREIR